MKDKKWLKYLLENTQNSPYCAQATILEKWYELEPIDLKEIEKMKDKPSKTFEELMGDD